MMQHGENENRPDADGELSSFLYIDHWSVESDQINKIKICSCFGAFLQKRCSKNLLMCSSVLLYYYSTILLYYCTVSLYYCTITVVNGAIGTEAVFMYLVKVVIAEAQGTWGELQGHFLLQGIASHPSIGRWRQPKTKMVMVKKQYGDGQITKIAMNKKQDGDGCKPRWRQTKHQVCDGQITKMATNKKQDGDGWKQSWRRPKCRTRGFKTADHKPLGDVTVTTSSTSSIQSN